MAKPTKGYRIKYWILFLISLALNIAPITVYVVRAIINSTLVHEKLALSMTVLVVIILTIVSLVNKVALRSRLWILLIGIYICLDNFINPLIVFAACQILDELIVTPLKKHYKTRLTISKEIDRRM